MTKVGTGFKISLDGFIVGPEGDVGRLFDWYSGGDTEIEFPGNMVVKVSPASAKHIRDVQDRGDSLGAEALRSRRRLGGRHPLNRHPLNVPTFVVTHTVPREWVYEGSPFTFVTDGVESAVEQARAVAGDKNVGVGAPTSRSSASRPGWSKRSLSTWCPYCSGRASNSSTTWAPSRSGWNARG